MKKENWKHVHTAKSGGSGMFYFVGFIGALIYFLQSVNSFWGVILALLKSCVWPAFFVYHIFRSLNI